MDAAQQEMPITPRDEDMLCECGAYPTALKRYLRFGLEPKAPARGSTNNPEPYPTVGARICSLYRSSVLALYAVAVAGVVPGAHDDC